MYTIKIYLLISVLLQLVADYKSGDGLLKISKTTAKEKEDITFNNLSV